MEVGQLKKIKFSISIETLGRDWLHTGFFDFDRDRNSSSIKSLIPNSSSISSSNCACWKPKFTQSNTLKSLWLQFSNRSSMKFQYFIESYCIYVPRSNFISCSLPAGLHFQHFSTSVFLHRKEQGLQHYKPASTDDQIPAGPPSLPHFP